MASSADAALCGAASAALGTRSVAARTSVLLAFIDLIGEELVDHHEVAAKREKRMLERFGLILLENPVRRERREITQRQAAKDERRTTQRDSGQPENQASE